MEFKVGQTVRLIDNAFMDAPLGATAVVDRVGNMFIRVTWKRNANGQKGGSFFYNRFEPLHAKGQQLVFNFMM